MWRGLSGSLIVGCSFLSDAGVAASRQKEPSSALSVARVAQSTEPESGVAAEASRDLLIEAWASSLSAPEVVWKFRAASPSSGPPAVSRDGNVYFSTLEGYIHALTSKGQFRWSYTLDGMPLGAPLTGPDGRIYLTTNAGRIYALDSDGQLAWVKRSSRRILSGPVFSGPSSLVYSSAGRRLRSISLKGGRAWSRALAVSAAEPPVAHPSGGVVVATRDNGLWWLSRSNRSRMVRLPAAAERSPIATRALTYVIVDGEVLAYSKRTRTIRWRAEANRVSISAGGEHLVTEHGGDLIWRAPQDGRVRWTAAMPDRASASPLILSNAVAVVPLVSGRLFVAEPRSGRTALVEIAKSALRRPVAARADHVPGSAQQVVVASGDGKLAMIDLRRWFQEKLDPGNPVDTPTSPR